MAKEIAIHHDYERCLPDWRLMRAAFEGERSIKEAGEEHLPAPDGFSRTGGAKSRRYLSYIARASFPDLVGPTVLGMVGIMNAEAPAFELPPTLEGLEDSADRNGLSLDMLKQRLDREAVMCGRVILVSDISPSGSPCLTVYTAECLVNWAETAGADGRMRLSLAVLRENVPPDGADPLYSSTKVEQHRVYRMDPVLGATVRVLRHDAVKGYYEYEPTRQLLRSGGREALADLPIVVIGALDVTPDVDVIPLLGLANLARRIYRQDADYQSALHNTSFPTLVIRGELELGPDESGAADIELGAGAALLFSDPSSTADFLEFSGAGVSSQRSSIQDDFVQAITIAVQSLQGRGVESGEALGLRMKAKTASLASITQATAAGMQAAIRTLAVWLRSDPEAVTVTASLDFQEGPLDPSILTATVNAWTEGAVPVELVYEAFRRVRLTSLTNDELDAGGFRPKAEPANDPEPSPEG